MEGGEAGARPLCSQSLASDDLRWHDVSMPAVEAHTVLLPLAGFSGAKALFLIMIVALPLILIIGTWLKRSPPR